MDTCKDVVLHPGDFHFYRPVPYSSPPAKLRTLLGSCVSVILWHPALRLAGMSHAMLPSRNGRSDVVRLEGRFCDEAISLFCQEIHRAKAHPQQFEVYLVGGGRMFLSEKVRTIAIGDRNIEMTRNLLWQAKFRPPVEHVGNDGYRKVEIDLTSGEVSVTFANERINLTTAGG